LFLGSGTWWVGWTGSAWLHPASPAPPSPPVEGPVGSRVALDANARARHTGDWSGREVKNQENVLSNRHPQICPPAPRVPPPHPLARAAKRARHDFEALPSTDGRKKPGSSCLKSKPRLCRTCTAKQRFGCWVPATRTGFPQHNPTTLPANMPLFPSCARWPSSDLLCAGPAGLPARACDRHLARSRHCQAHIHTLNINSQRRQRGRVTPLEIHRDRLGVVATRHVSERTRRRSPERADGPFSLDLARNQKRKVTWGVPREGRTGGGGIQQQRGVVVVVVVNGCSAFRRPVGDWHQPASTVF